MPSARPAATTFKHRGALRTYVEFAVAWAIFNGLRMLPRRVALAIGKGLGAVARLVLPHLRRHAQANLQLAFPALDDQARGKIERGTFRNLGRALGEVTQFPKLNRANIESVVVYEGLENYRHAVAQGRGVILLTGHIGAWELSVYAHSIYGYPMSFLARRVDNPLVERLAETNRARFGNRSIDKKGGDKKGGDKKGGVREVLKILKTGGVVGILADLNSSREEGVFVDFFGLPACTTTGIATLALRTGAIVLPGYILWDEARQIHHLCFEPPLETVNTGNPKDDIVTNTAHYTKALQEVICRHPDQWLWIHRRWKTRPAGEADIY